MTEFTILEDESEEEFDLPKYSDEGYIFVKIISVDPNPEYYRYELEVLEYTGSAFWIQEGEGFDYWCNEHLDIELPGFYVIEDVSGHYYRGDWSYGEDDDVDWYLGNVRRATEEEIKAECL